MVALLRLHIIFAVFVLAEGYQFGSESDRFLRELQNDDEKPPNAGETADVKITSVETKQLAVLLPEKDLESIIYLTAKICKRILEKSTLCGIGRSIMGFEKQNTTEELQTFYVVYTYLPAEELTNDYAEELKNFLLESFVATYVDYLIMDYDGSSRMYMKST